MRREDIKFTGLKVVPSTSGKHSSEVKAFENEENTATGSEMLELAADERSSSFRRNV